MADLNFPSSPTINDTYSSAGSSWTWSGVKWVANSDAAGVSLSLYQENPTTFSSPTANGANSVAIGDGAFSLDASTVAIGFGATASGAESVAIGGDGCGVAITLASGAGSLAGIGGTADGFQSVAIGWSSQAWDNAVGIGGIASGTCGTAVGFGAGATHVGSAAFGANSRALQLCAVAVGHFAQATGACSIAVGAAACSIANSSTAIGNSYASGAGSFAAANGGNTNVYGAQGANSIAIGPLNKVTSLDSVNIGYSNLVQGNKSVAIGYDNQSNTDGYTFGCNNQAQSWGTSIGTGNAAYGLCSIAIGAKNLVASNANMGIAIGTETDVNADHDYGIAFGIGAQTRAKGHFAYANFVSNAQLGTWILTALTSDDTLTNLLSFGGLLSGPTIILPDNSAYFFSGTIIARESSANGTRVGAWEIKGAIRRESGALTTTLVKSTIDEFSAPAGWTISLSADTTNGGLSVTAQGSALTNIRWVATINTSEVTY